MMKFCLLAFFITLAFANVDSLVSENKQLKRQNSALLQRLRALTSSIEKAVGEKAVGEKAVGEEAVGGCAGNGIGVNRNYNLYMSSGETWGRYIFDAEGCWLIDAKGNRYNIQHIMAWEYATESDSEQAITVNNEEAVAERYSDEECAGNGLSVNHAYKLYMASGAVWEKRPVDFSGCWFFDNDGNRYNIKNIMAWEII